MIKIIDLSEVSELIPDAARWFSYKWGIDAETYKESMESSCEDNAVPRWYVALINGTIAGGLGVIENDFHERKDLAPNVCGLYVEEKYRGRGIAGELLGYVCKDMKKRGIDTLYLATDHTGFYEKFGWEFLTMVKSNDGESRLYIKKN